MLRINKTNLETAAIQFCSTISDAESGANYTAGDGIDVNRGAWIWGVGGCPKDSGGYVRKRSPGKT
jgi:hypothetical protein